MAKQSMSVRERRAHMRMRVRRFLARIRKEITYGELAKEFNTAPMAIGQILKGIVNDNPFDKRLTKKVKAS